MNEYQHVCFPVIEFTFPFQPPGGSSNLWDLVSVINGQDDSLLPASYSKGVMHMRHLLKFKTVRCCALRPLTGSHKHDKYMLLWVGNSLDSKIRKTTVNTEATTQSPEKDVQINYLTLSQCQIICCLTNIISVMSELVSVLIFGGNVLYQLKQAGTSSPQTLVYITKGP